MANVIKIKGNGTPGSAPQVADLDYRELALNYADKRLYFKNSSGSIDYFAGGGLGEAEVAEITIHGPFPTGDYADLGTGSIDAFGVSTNFRTYDAMGGVGYLRTIDLGSIQE